MKRFLVIAAALICSQSFGDVQRITVTDLARNSENVFIGKVLEVEETKDTGGILSLPVKTFTVFILKNLKGVTKETIAVKQYSAVSSPAKKGEYILWFLTPESRTGHAYTTYGGYGDFRVENGFAANITDERIPLHIIERDVKATLGSK
jgi:hypothetical protein